MNEPKKLRSAGFWLPNDVKAKWRQKWVCLWADEHGNYIVNTNGEFLSAESWHIYDKKVENKMRSAAQSYGIKGGEPKWVPGRKITQMESDDQMERLLQGKVPDQQEESLIDIEETWMEQNK